jgi:hypothetical protein
VVQGEPAEHTEPVVERDDDDVALPRESAAVVHVAGADCVGAPVDPHEHRTRAVVGSGCVDVQEEAVLVRPYLAGRDEPARHRRRLRRAGTEVRGIVDPGPRVHRQGWPEPAVTNRRLGIADARVALTAVEVDTLDLPEGRVCCRHQSVDDGTGPTRTTADMHPLAAYGRHSPSGWAKRSAITASTTGL